MTTTTYIRTDRRDYNRVELGCRTSYITEMVLKLILAAVLCSAACTFAQVPLPAGEHQATINGVRLWFKVAGQARREQPPVLFLHGGPGYNSYSFEKTIGAQLEAHVQMVYLAERGSGRSERPANRDYRMTTLVQDVEALRRSLGIQKLSLMGHSFGGTIALEYASRYPEHVEKLIVLDGAADMPATFALWEKQVEQRYPAEWHSTLDSPSGDALKRAEASHDDCAIAKAEFSAEMTTLQKTDGQAFHDWQQFHSQGALRPQRALDQASGLRNTGEISSTYFGEASEFPCYRFSAFDRLTMPVSLIVGRFDGAVGVGQMRTLAAHLPNAHLSEFAESGHFPYADEPRKFVHDVTIFLESGR